MDTKGCDSPRGTLTDYLSFLGDDVSIGLELIILVKGYRFATGALSLPTG